jgi:hypothetical protein
LLSVVLIFLGYTTYTSVLIRSNAKPPMNENDPSTLARLTSYLGREQYGEAPLFLPRRYSEEAQHQGMYTAYTSDMDFLIRYQLNHMFFRYLFWNYIGAEGEYQDAGVGWNQTLGIPFLVGLFGLYALFKKDWKMGLVFLSMFIILGPVLALYQNQQEPQPRERDYFYVGAFFVFSLWIGVGVVALIDELRRRIHSRNAVRWFTYAVVGLLVFAIPVNLARTNWHTHDRSGNYVAWDFSYNLLQSCEADAILFTNGDNDTFPLWYLQDVEGIRRDVRIVNLSLANTPWYLKELKDKPYYPEAKPVPLGLTETQIDRLQPVPWESRKMELPVPPDAFARYGVTDTALIRKGAIDFVISYTLQVGDTKGIRIQDRVVLDIMFTNKWRRPLYFASSGAADSRLGLDDYLWLRGLAYRLEPRKAPGHGRGVEPDVLEANLFHEAQGFSRTPASGFKFRGTADPKVYFDENTTRMLSSYRWAFLQLAEYYAADEKTHDRAVAALDRMEEVLPRSKVPLGWDLTTYVASFYHRLNKMDRFNEIAAEVEPVAKKMVESGRADVNSYNSPYSVLLEIYDVKKDYSSMLEILNELATKFPNDPGLKQRIAQVQTLLKEQQTGTGTRTP